MLIHKLTTYHGKPQKYLYFLLTIPRIKKMIRLIILNFRYLTNWIRIYPDFIIIGAAKCGTTSLFYYLKQHPDIKTSYVKEVKFFNKNNYYLGFKRYRSFFPSLFFKYFYKYILKRKFITGEGSSDYLRHPIVAKRIYSLLPKVKLIILLRNPVDRAYSHYNMNVRFNLDKLSFEEAIEKEHELLKGGIDRILIDKHYKKFKFNRFFYLLRGIYLNQIKFWFRYFPKEQILILKSEDFFDHPPDILKKIFKFLEIPNWRLFKYNKWKKANYQKMDDKTRNWLINYYKPYNKRLYEFLGINFNWD